MAVGKETYCMNICRFFCATFLFITTVHAAEESPDIAGHYFLQGAMEMGSQLLLRKDGTFAAQIAYGSADGYAKGTWQTQADTLSLLVDTPESAHTAKSIYFEMSSKSDWQKIKNKLLDQPDKAQDLKLAESNYVLNMNYIEIEAAPPTPNAVDLYFEFTQGPPTHSQFIDYVESCETVKVNGRDVESCGTTSQQLPLPFDPQRTLNKIGVRMSKGSEPTQWFDVSSTGRMFEIGWKKTHGKLSFAQPDETGLSQTQDYYQHDQDILKKIEHNYLISLYENKIIIPPAITPFDVYWHFQDGSEQQQVWADSKQLRLVQPISAKRTLQKIGFRAQGSTEPIQWIDDIAPTDQWFSISWQNDDYGQNTDIGELFRNMTLEIKPNCLQFDLGDNKACYRK